MRNTAKAREVRRLASFGMGYVRIATTLGISPRQAHSYARGVRFIGPRECGRRGGNGGHASLSENDVDEIRRQLARGDRTRKGIAMEYGVTDGTISAIASGAAWGWLPNPHGPPKRSRVCVASRDADAAKRIASGESISSVARSLGLKARTLSERLRLALPRKPRHRVTPEERVEIVRRYEAGESIETIRQAIGGGSIASVLKAAGVKMRPRGLRYDYAQRRLEASK